ncbi:MAG: hypothetical protein E7Z86_09630 [Methanosphaera stadtmanae]|jgi:hypothetical protein|nr:hypothetical protein [Methanosphaera stadtmanae]
MSLSEELYNSIKNDLEGDFPNITSITKENDKIIIKADNDTLWEIFDILYKGMDNIEFNFSPNEEANITINY